ncbi:putative transmembrane protein [Rhodopirellula islandica]|uniref:Transmembrane protein n=1 Tax=Rhodopirellula islandica TaxID=595434 RepID=A0A0J1E6Y0_RHOIS|nr:hypothetical protein [Rhodopirellula islandica]KLU01214.1 putative transmembrane protein [Rhodopirellula islandica]
MSHAPHSPYSQPVPNSSSGGGGSSKNTVIIVAIVSVTMLLMCGGVLGLGYYAVERLASELNAVNYDYMADDEETPTALQHALSENEVLQEKVGEIESVEFAAEHNLDNSVYTDEYFYRVIGTVGEAIVRVEVSAKEDEWFDRVDLIPDETDLDTRVQLETIPVPFDSAMAQSTHELIKENPTILEEVGTVQYVAYDWELTDDHTDAEAASYVFVVRGDAGETHVRVLFNDYDYVTVERIEWLEDPNAPELLFGEPEEDSSSKQGTSPADEAKPAEIEPSESDSKSDDAELDE